jgi:hypothetical protein
MAPYFITYRAPAGDRTRMITRRWSVRRLAESDPRFAPRSVLMLVPLALLSASMLVPLALLSMARRRLPQGG